MAKTGRKSAAALALVSSISSIPRAKAPANITKEEAAVWDAVVASQPADWFNGATKPLLVFYCRHVCGGEYVAKLIQTLKAKLEEKAQAGDDVLVLMLSATDAIDKLFKIQERESRTCASLATKMRITQQATTNHRGNAIEKPKPWED